MGEFDNFRLTKSERLSNVKLIDNVFKSTHYLKAYPLIFTYQVVDFPCNIPLQLVFTASKRSFKKAVDRNRIKRLIKDRFRLIKPSFIHALGDKKLIGAFIYTSKTLPEYKEIDKALTKIVAKLHEVTA